MKIYFAVTGNNEPIYLSEEKLNLLMSFHYYKDKIEIVKNLVSKGIDIFIDSGAFSAFNSKEEINIDQYIWFIKQTGATYYAGLDVIGDEKKTMSNQLYMEQQGLMPVPTFHKGESLEYLHMLIEKYEHIALGGMVQSENLGNYLPAAWKEIMRKKPTLKVHGFGLTNQSHIENYPWFSVDSSSFKSGKRFGRLILYNSTTKQLETKDYNVFLKDLYNLTLDERIKKHEENPNYDTAFIYKYTDTLSALSYHRFVQSIIDKGISHSHLEMPTLFDSL